jgi:hypothetical protein
VLCDRDSLEEYVDEIVMKFGEDAVGLLMIVVPIALKINVHIVNIETKEEKVAQRVSLFFNHSSQEDILHRIANSEHLNLHKETLYVMRKGGHYDITYA